MHAPLEFDGHDVIIRELQGRKQYLTFFVGNVNNIVCNHQKRLDVQ
jgi:hypothetical protein